MKVTMPSDERGYTLAELVLVMMIFSVVMTLISVSFSNILKSSSAIMKSSDSDIGGLIGLELLRSDLESAGFGLPWSLPGRPPAGISYKETALGEMVTGYPGTAASSYNDSPPDLPRAYQAGDRVGVNGSDYLVLKGTAVGMTRVSRSWGYLNYSSTGSILKPGKSGMELSLNKSDRAIVLKSGVESGVPTRELVTSTPDSTVFTLELNGTLPNGFMPQSRRDSYLVYGVAALEKDASSTHLMLNFPYNRADYYIGGKESGGTCAPNTGVLYKTTINHNGGAKAYPILDCVADLQVVFMLETSNDGTPVKEYDISAYDAAELRGLLREVRVYVMAQQGRVDPGYNYPMPDPGNVIALGDRRWSASDFLQKGWQHYHWKVYSIVVQPKNL
jgi:prepilin-type N-terminal cleavage/methylation domain-containing protein